MFASRLSIDLTPKCTQIILPCDQQSRSVHQPRSTNMSFTLPNLPSTCAIDLFTLPPDVQGFIVLGATRVESELLRLCCPGYDNTYISRNNTPCARIASCKVQACALEDPSYAFVARGRGEWEIPYDATFECVEGTRKSSRGGKTRRELFQVWVVFSVLVVMVMMVQ